MQWSPSKQTGSPEDTRLSDLPAHAVVTILALHFTRVKPGFGITNSSRSDPQAGCNEGCSFVLPEENPSATIAESLGYEEFD
jgi:hypothetical protein